MSNTCHMCAGSNIPTTACRQRVGASHMRKIIGSKTHRAIVAVTHTVMAITTCNTPTTITPRTVATTTYRAVIAEGMQSDAVPRPT